MTFVVAPLINTPILFAGTVTAHLSQVVQSPVMIHVIIEAAEGNNSSQLIDEDEEREGVIVQILVLTHKPFHQKLM